MKRGHPFFLQRALRLALATSIVAIVATVIIIAQAPVASAIVPAVFDPIPSTTFGTQSVYGGVVTDGRGTFHAVVREDWPTQAIAYRRSVDGGRTWTTIARFDGDDGGATRPSVAVDGDRVAIVFIGARCTTLDLCDEAPYLVVSRNAGLTWDVPRRLGADAFDVKVAVDDDRTWVAWKRSGKVELRGTTNGGITTFASKSYAGFGPAIDAADGTMAMAFSTFNPPLGQSIIGAVTARVRSVGPLQGIVRPRTATPKVATAGGYSHLLLVDDPVVPGPTTPQVSVATAGPGSPFAPADTIMPAGSATSIDAVTGSVAVAVLDKAGTTWVAASSNDGLGFSAAIPVSSSGPGNTTQVDMAFAAPPQGRPLARFNWTVPPRYVDTDGDGIPDPANGSGNDTVNELRVAANRTMMVDLDGCDSWPSDGRTIAMQTRAAQVAVRPNAAVRGVHIVQAPADASLMVAGRPSLVQATIDASVDAPVQVDVTTTVTAHAPWGDLELVPATTEQVTLAPGRNELLLPATSTFTADDGETLTAEVEVSDPMGASPADAADNSMRIAPEHGVAATMTRPLRILFGRGDVGGETLSCQVTKGTAERMAA